MISYAPSFVSNGGTLRKVQKENATLSVCVSKLRSAYLDYLSKEGSPTVISPVGLNATEAEELEKIYGGETIKYGVRWIGQFRRAKHLSHCPLCGSHNPSQLEHYLPKSYFPEYTIFSWNLVPTCSICNPKRGHHAHKPGQAHPLIHPYFEPHLALSPVFNAAIRPPYEAVTFLPKVMGPYSEDTMRRLEWQLEKCFDLDKFAIWLESSWRVFHISNAGVFASAAEMREYLLREYSARVKITGPNSWDSIFYRALLADSVAQNWLRTTEPIL